MGNLNKVIDDYISFRNMTYTDLAKEVGVAKSTISNYLNKNNALSVYTFSKLVYVVFENDKDKQEQMIINYLSTLKDRMNINVKVAFAIAHLNDYLKLMKFISQLCKKSDDIEMKRLERVFNLYNARLDGEDVKDIYLDIEKARTISNKKNYDIEIFCDLLSMLILCDLGDFGLMEGYKVRIENNIELVTNSYLKNLYYFWVKELWSYSLLRTDMCQDFEEHNIYLKTYKDLKFFPVMEAFLNIRCGENYMFSDYKKSLNFFLEAINILCGAKESLKFTIALNDINFIRIVWWKDIDKIEFNRLHPAEHALFLIKEGKKNEAINILENIEMKKGYLSPMQTCYMGMAKSDLALVKKSINMIKTNNDFLNVKIAEGIYDKYIENVM
ncbi:XRE family transcriptional regulator (plasmid) [Bacillus mycoides]|uniref:AimR family lysis-lysogeny pheromone receptor n=1 Tax=Bacillus mycoides TaxID=1405 RepID=UPI001C01C70F|nr:AimR family lysis-lysogeny pheromone receptor [Bacillus mycoides]QWH20926.1 XRE family transcriptional regulator [Bacillus mycoides]